MKTIEARKESLKGFIAVLPQVLGAPPGNKNASGGGGDAGDEGKSEQEIKKSYKNKTKKELKDISSNNKDWLKQNKDKVGSKEHRQKSREVNVADKIIKGFY
jgi:hypothetical protein